MCAEAVLLSYGLPETLCMAHSNCGKRIKLSLIDLNCKIDEYHTGVV